MENKTHFKEYAGVLTAFLVVLSYVGIGFVQTAVVVTTGGDVKLPPDWMAAMLSLASAALGYLIGKQPTTSIVQGATEALQRASTTVLSDVTSQHVDSAARATSAPTSDKPAKPPGK